MSYRVLARSYRSGTFDEIVGQDAIATTLTNAVASGRIHHGYLFTGTRGVGKTSMARILAKALNCLAVDAPTTTPCLQCSSCLAIAEGEDLDVVEIDAASNTGVDNIRDLRGHTTLRPARSRFKVYIIDEVHMLSTGAFNALLKTLEEPPPHVKFVLATTEAHKVPATIQSRCQRFDFRAISTPVMVQQLRRIVDAEEIEADDDVLRRVARLACGSMRDALSLLDKVISFAADRLTLELVNDLIPPPHDELAAAVMERIADSDAAGALQQLDRALQSGYTVERFCDRLISHVRTLMMIRVCGPETELVDVASEHRPHLKRQSDGFDAPTYVYMLTLLEELRRNVKFSGSARALADAAVVRLAMTEKFTDLKRLLETLSSDPAAALEKKNAPGLKAGMPDAARMASAEAGSVAATVERRGTQPSGSPRDVAQPGAPVSQRQSRPNAQEWQCASTDPLVQRVVHAVDGKLLTIRRSPARQTEPSADSTTADSAARKEEV